MRCPSCNRDLEEGQKPSIHPVIVWGGLVAKDLDPNVDPLYVEMPCWQAELLLKEIKFSD